MAMGGEREREREEAEEKKREMVTCVLVPVWFPVKVNL